MSNRGLIWLRAAVHIGALAPLAVLVWQFASGNLTANPIQAIQLRTGKTAINLLLLSLACTPIYIASGFKPVLPLRRLLGMYAFTYAGLHFMNFVGVDYGFNFSLIRKDALIEKRFIAAGLAALLLLLPLAITSTKGWVKKLGRNWQRLHWMVYPAAGLAVIHFIWQTKADFRLPLVYGCMLLLLLVVRVPIVRNYITSRIRKPHSNTS